jgi:hypothetical protein
VAVAAAWLCLEVAAQAHQSLSKSQEERALLFARMFADAARALFQTLQ